MIPDLHNEMILASAGSGKTHTLVNRFLRLLRAGVAPEKLMALTFTRKAAAEFFTKILMRLAQALEVEAKREALARELGLEELSENEVCEDLRRLIQSAPRLQLGTLDAFFVRILQTFYLEFGFSAGFTLLDDYGAREAARRAQQAAFKSLRDERGVTAFLEGMRLATFGTEEKSLQRHLEGFVGRHHGVFLKGSDQGLWGGERAIWESGCVWLQGGELDVNGAATALMNAVEADTRYTPKRDVGGWEKAVTLFRSVRPDRLIRSKPNTVAERLLEAGLALADGTAAIRFGKKDIAPTAEQCRHAFTLVHHVMRCEIQAAQERTRGLWQVLQTYESAYQREVRSKGQLTFSDVQRLLAKGDVVLTQETTDKAEERLLEIAYRLDARSDHWMLDEFQDTSRVQWRVIANLVDEVVQGGLPDRSFFYVGDVKQAIFGWREGDARLFHQIFDHYNRGSEETAGAIVPVALNESYRCCQTVIDAVNRVFSSHSTLQIQFGAALADRWSGVWGDHTTNVDHPGYVALLNPIKATSARSVEKDARYELAAETLRRLRPIERGLTCGVLVRQNSVGQGFADYLRKHTEIPVEAETHVQVVADNPVTSAFLSLFMAAAHPGDTLSWQHLWLTPFGQVLDQLKWGYADCVREILSSVHRDGFEAVIRDWLDRLKGVGVELDGFSLRRVETLCDSAATFDARGDRSLTSFVDFAGRFTERQQSGEGAVQVMSVHKAKGLEFDVVLVLLAGTDDLRSLRHLSVVTHSDDEEPVFVTGVGDHGQLQWALDMPRPTYARVDPVLRGVLEARESEVCYENLCLLYVAMTRAKRALYLICDPVGASSESNNYSRILRETLADGEPQALDVQTEDGPKTIGHRLYSDGPRDWVEHFAPEEDAERRSRSVVPTEPITLREAARSALTKRSPSQSHREEGSPVVATGWELLSERAGDALAYGTLVHALFESIEWLEDLGDDWEKALPVHWDQKVPIVESDTRAKVHAEVLACLKQPEIHRWFSRETQGGEKACVWREKAFDVIMDGEWVSGVFDRVVFGADGTTTILDFKSNRLAGADEERIQAAASAYAGQMSDYRRAMTLLADEVSAGEINGLLLFTDVGRLIET